MDEKFRFGAIDINNISDFYVEIGSVYYKIEIDIYLRNHFDVALEYLEIAFVAQELSKISDVIKVYETPICNNYPYAILIIKTVNPDIIISKLKWFQIYFSGEFMSDEDEIDAREDFSVFEEAILEFNIIPALPDYCDKYFANYIFSNYDWNPESIQEILITHPEWAFYTWKSAWSKKLGFDFYVSSQFWLLDTNADLFSALKFASDYKQSNSLDKFLKPIYIITDMNQIFLFTQEEIISISLDLHFFITRCAGNLFIYDENKFYNSEFNWGISTDFCIASDFSLIVFDGNVFRYILFYNSSKILKRKEIDNLASVIQKLSIELIEKSSNSVKIKCNWSLINDEIFEQICYDLILRDGRFIEKETIKMGLSKSRDGGRDILTKIMSHSGEMENNQLWIIQCKLSNLKKSLGRNDVLLSELIDEYNPAGVIIATNMIIDAGTYDKLEKIKQNRKINIEYWDGLRIERLLNRNPDLFKVYNLTIIS
jgi:hypothetical protein